MVGKLRNTQILVYLPVTYVPGGTVTRRKHLVLTSATEDETEKECVAEAKGKRTEGKPLVMLQVKCRSICNKILEFCNIIDT